MTDSKKTSENNAVMQIRLPLQLREDFQSICKREGYSGSGLVKKWIRDFVSTQKTAPRSS